MLILKSALKMEGRGVKFFPNPVGEEEEDETPGVKPKDGFEPTA